MKFRAHLPSLHESASLLADAWPLPGIIAVLTSGSNGLHEGVEASVRVATLML